MAIIKENQAAIYGHGLPELGLVPPLPLRLDSALPFVAAWPKRYGKFRAAATSTESHELE